MSIIMFFTDSHAHLTSSQLYDEIEGVLTRAESTGVKRIINICTDTESLIKGMALSKSDPWIFNAAAAHPHDVEREGELFFPHVQQQARQGNLIAVGETGLDYHYHHSTPEKQQQYLRMHLQLALEAKLPVIIHCREAFKDLFSILDEEYCPDHKHGPGVLHCFTGSIAEAEQVLERGWFLSLSGIITFKKSIELREVARLVPLDRLLIETDAPYLAPNSRRGKQNEPSYIVETASVLAALKGVTLAELAEATTKNAARLFSFDESN